MVSYKHNENKFNTFIFCYIKIRIHNSSPQGTKIFMKTCMKKSDITSCVKLILLISTSLIVLFCCNNKHKTLQKYSEEEEKDMYDEAAMAQQFEIERTKDPVLGYVPKERLIAAYQYAELSKLNAMRSRMAAGTWVERGPRADIVGVNNSNPRDGSLNVSSGRIRAVWVDLSDINGNTVWAGGIGGGLWKTTNFKTSPATWVPVNDFFTNMAIGSICQDPSNPNIMYFGTGERTYNTDAIRGGGVWKSIDNGANWTLLSATASYYNVSKLLCDAMGNLYVGTIMSNTGGGSSGLFRSTDGGATFTNISPNGTDSKISDFIISSTGRFHLCTGYYNSATPGYRYTDNPSTVTSATWTSAAVSFPVTSAANTNCVLACKGDTLYAVPSNSSFIVPAIYKSTNGGINWTATATSPPNTGFTAFSNGQGWYCLAAAVNPFDANNVIVGSLNCYGTNDGGATWTQRSDWVAGVGATGQYVHADIQTIKWFGNGEILMGTDGGMFYSPDAGITFEDRNTGLNIKQFYSCAYHPTSTDYFLAGAQDNGCHQFTTPGINTTIEVTGGDGAFVHIDQNEPLYQYTSYVRNRYRRSTNGGTNWSAINFYRSGTTGNPVDFGSFINATDYDNTGNILYCGSNAGEFFRWSTAQTTPAGSYFFTSGTPAFPAGADVIAVSNLTGSVSAIKVSPYTANRIYLGTNSSKLIKIDNANTIASGAAGTDITGASFPAGATISCIATGMDDNNLIATFSNYGVINIWVSANGGTTWTAIDGNLPDMPVRWAIFDPSSNTKAWIATETGIWSTTAINGSSTVWTASPGFPTVRTNMIKYKAFDQTLVAATHGRGLWTQSLATTLPINNFVLKGIWKNNSTVELYWNFSNVVSSSFEVESSNNGIYFTKKGTSQTTTTFVDEPASTEIFYRIKSKNIFGNIGYSNVIHLKKIAEQKDITGIKIFSNPIKTELEIAFIASASGVAHYQVSSINGQVFWKKEEEISSGNYRRKWNMQTLKPGTYVFTIVLNNKKITEKFLKL